MRFCKFFRLCLHRAAIAASEGSFSAPFSSFSAVDRLRYRESTRCSRVTYPESCITKYPSIRSKDAQGTPTQSPISPSILTCEEMMRFCRFLRACRLRSVHAVIHLHQVYQYTKVNDSKYWLEPAPKRIRGSFPGSWIARCRPTAQAPGLQAETQVYREKKRGRNGREEEK